MSASKSSVTFQKAAGCVLLVLGAAVFAVRLLHEGAYAMPRGNNMIGGFGSFLVGALLVWAPLPRVARWLTLAASPVVFFLGLYATMAELEETISLYATDSAGRPAELRLWIVDREDGEWVGMPGWKAAEHGLDGAQMDILRKGTRRCVKLTVHDDRPTVRAIHKLKVDKYEVAQAAAAIGFYPSEARDTSVAVRFEPCPAE